MKIPFVDLRRQHEPLQDEIAAAVARALSTGGFVGGAEVDGFEAEFASYLGVDQVITVGSGTAALHHAFRALEIGAGDEVIVPANTFIATAEAVVLAGATPVFCDVEPDTGLLSVRTVSPVITDRTRAIVPVHLYGNVVNIDPLLALAASRGLRIVEDTAQAHGAYYESASGRRRAGSMGDIGCFSFYPTKNLGAIGEGGAVCTNDPTLAHRLRQLRDHGQADKHVHTMVGDNARLSTIQAAALRTKLPRLDGWNARRRAIAARYDEVLSGLPATPVLRPAWSESVYHLYVMQVEDRDRWRGALGDLGIATAIHYPTAIHLQPAFAFAGRTKGDLPVAERMAAEILSLPMFPEMTHDEVEAVVDALSEVAAAITGSSARAA
jgi:dTDP-4-amino-4,6-dideoxygalactose transaminase